LKIYGLGNYIFINQGLDVTGNVAPTGERGNTPEEKRPLEEICGNGEYFFMPWT
jgi:hypothetical protein